MNKWVRFWFEGNQTWGSIEDEEDWNLLLNVYGNTPQNYKELLEAKECDRSDIEKQKGIIPKFGFAIECTGLRTLGEFLKENGMLTTEE